VIDDHEHSESRQPVRVHDAAVVNRPDRRACLCAHLNALPPKLRPGALLAVATEQAARYRPRQLATRRRKRLLRVDRKLGERRFELPNELTQPLLFGAQTLDFLLF
jgi:hypothetical protein